jgi:hypothetical protein
MTVVDDELAQRRDARGGGETPPDAEPGADPPAEDEPGEGQGEDEGDGDSGGEPEAVAEPKPPKLLQEPIPGVWDAISSDFGGAAPDRSEIRLLGGKMPIDGSFPKGTEIDLLVRVRITGTLGQDLEDAYGTRGGTVRRHFARMIRVQKVN